MAKNGRILSKKISRKTLKVFRNVLIKIPKSSKHMSFVPENKGYGIEAHWKNGLVVNRGEILFRFFYGIGDVDLGSRVIADVKVMEKRILVKTRVFGKVVGSEIFYLYLDIKKISDNSAEVEMKFWSCDPKVEIEKKNEFLIPRSQEKIVFLELKKEAEEDAA